MEIRPAQLADMDLIYGLDHSFQTDHVWQLSNKAATNEYSAILRLAKLPRAITVQYAHDAVALRRVLHRADFVWVLHSPANQRDIHAYLAMTLLPWQHTALVTSLCVRPDSRRKGLATRLLGVAMTQARDEGMHSLTADVPTKAYPATRFYQARGFKLAGYSENHYASHDIALLFASRIRS
jgi:ribosomal protein S18 acetylase RimI-like enzyme